MGAESRYLRVQLKIKIMTEINHLVTMRINKIRILLILTIALFNAGRVYSQNAPEKTAPFTAVKWLQDNPYVMVDGEWYLLVALEGTKANHIVVFCQKEYGNKWQKRFSEDLVEVMQVMNKSLPETVSMKLIKDGKTHNIKRLMTKENRKAVWEYNNSGNLKAFAPNENTTRDKEQETIMQETAETVNINMDKPFKFKSAKIEYEIIGNKMYEGKEIVYIDDYGKTVVVITDKPGIMGQKENKTIIWKDNSTTEIDHVNKTWQEYPIRQKITEPPVIAFANETQRTQGGYVKKEPQKVTDKNCEVYEHAQLKVTYYLWKGIDLKLENYSLGKTGYVRTATKVEEGTGIPANVLKIPEGYTEK